MSSEETLRALGASARALFSPARLAALEEAFDRHAAYCRGKVYNEEGIPMFLVLEDASSRTLATPAAPAGADMPISADALFDLLLVVATEVYKQQLEARGEPLRPDDISLMLEVLAEHFFITAHPPRPTEQA